MLFLLSSFFFLFLHPQEESLGIITYLPLSGQRMAVFFLERFVLRTRTKFLQVAAPTSYFVLINM